jgi:hypothetical protein
VETETPGSPDPAAGPASGTGQSRRSVPTWAWAVGGVVLVAVIAAVIVLVAGSGDEPGYNDAVRERFIAACTEDGGEPVRSTCECIYTRVEGEIPFDRFEAVDAELAEQAAGQPAGAPLTLPADIEAIRADCVD